LIASPEEALDFPSFLLGGLGRGDDHAIHGGNVRIDSDYRDLDGVSSRSNDRS
jgi:hypothetical protein